MDVNWSACYSSLGQFLTGVGVLTVSGICILYLLLRTSWDFFCANGRNNTNNDDGQKHKILLKFKVLTMSYLTCLGLFIISYLTMIVSMIFFNVKIYCWVADTPILLYAISRIILHAIFFTRYYTSFENSFYGMSRKTYVIVQSSLISIESVCYIVASILFYATAYDGYSDTICSDKHINSIMYIFIIVVLLDSSVSVTISIMFVRKLISLISHSESILQYSQTAVTATSAMNTMTTNIVNNNSNSNNSCNNSNNDYGMNKSKNNNNNNNNNNKDKKNSFNFNIGINAMNNRMASHKQLMEDAQNSNQRSLHALSLVKVATKFTVLVTFATLSSIILVVTLGPFVFSSFLCIDGIINGYCLLYCLSMYDNKYKKICYICHRTAFHCCLCFLFKYFQNNNNRNFIESQSEKPKTRMTRIMPKITPMTAVTVVTLQCSNDQNDQNDQNDNNTNDVNSNNMNNGLTSIKECETKDETMTQDMMIEDELEKAQNNGKSILHSYNKSHNSHHSESSYNSDNNSRSGRSGRSGSATLQVPKRQGTPVLSVFNAGNASAGLIYAFNLDDQIHTMLSQSVPMDFIRDTPQLGPVAPNQAGHMSTHL